MSSRRNFNPQKVSKFKILTRVIIGILVLTSCVSLIFCVHVFSKPLKKSTHLTPAQIEKLTAFDTSDSILITTIKSNALATHLATGDSSKIEKLNQTKSLINELMTGSLKASDLKSTLDHLAATYKLDATQIESLEMSYKKANLDKNIQQLKQQIDSTTLASAASISERADNIYTTSKQLLSAYLNSSNAVYPTQVDAAINVLNELNQKISHAKAFNDLFVNPSTTSLSAIQSFGELTNFEKPYASQFAKLSNYATVRDNILRHNSELKAFKQEVDAANALKDRSVQLEDFIGQSLGSAKAAIQAKGYKFELVDDSDTDDSAKIIDQYPKISDYTLITKNSTLKLRTPAKPKPKSKDESESSQSSNSKSSSDVVIIPPSSNSQPSSSTTAPSKSESIPIERN